MLYQILTSLPSATFPNPSPKVTLNLTTGVTIVLAQIGKISTHARRIRLGQSGELSPSDALSSDLDWLRSVLDRTRRYLITLP